MAAPANHSSRSGGSTLLIGCLGVVVLGILLVCGGGVGGWWFFLKAAPTQPIAEIPPEKKDNDDDPPKKKIELPIKIGPGDDKDKKKKPIKPKDTIVKDKLPPGDDRPKDLIAAMDALAPRQRLEEIKIVQLKGTVRLVEIDFTSAFTVTWEGTRQLKYDDQPNGFRKPMFLVVGESVWRTNTAGSTTQVFGEYAKFIQNTQYPTMLSQLTPLAEPGIEIERIGETKVRDKACYEVTIRRFGRPTYRLFFDKQSHLLAKVDFTGPCYDKNGKALPGTMLVEFFFSDYQTVDGIKQWKRQEQWRDGQPYTEMDVLEIRVLAEADDALFRGPITEKALIKARLDERKDRIRRTLADLGPDGGSDFSRLVAGLKHKQSRPRALARKGLQQYIELWRDKLTDPMVREDVAALAALLEREEDPTLQGFAIEAVSALGPAAAEAAPALVSVIRDNRETKLIPSAMRALRRIGVKTDDTLQAFENNLEHPDAAVREDAILAVLQLWPDRLPLAQLVELANQPGTAELVRSSAEQAIRQKLSTATAKDLPALRQGLKNSNRVIRLSFIDAIANLKEAGREAAPDLVPLVASVDNQVATQALKAIESIGQLMTVANESTDPVVLTAILRALSIKGGKTDPVLAIFEKHQDHANNDVRNICVIALLDLAPDRVTLNRLADLMLLPNPEIRVPAERMMKQKLTAVTVKDVPALRIGLKNPNKDIRMSFLDALGTLKDDGADAAAEVAGLLESSDADTVTKAAKVLEGLGKAGTKAVPVLEKLLDSQEKGVSLNAVLALSKVDPDSDAFKTKGIAILLDGLNPDVKELKGFLARPVNAKSAAVLFEIGEPAVAPLFKHLILRNNPKTVVGDMQLQATASRYVGYEMLKEFAKHAKAKDDKKTMQALKKYDTTLKAFWSPEESRLADQAKKLMGIQADTKQLYLNTASASYQAYLAIHALP